MKPKILFSYSLLFAFSHFSFAQHTFSICAVDTATQEVGSAGASCIPNSVIISDLHPGVGVIHTQAAYISYNQNFGRSLMNQGFTPKEIIDSLKASDLTPDIRQYGAVKFSGDTAMTHAFTGPGCQDYKNHITGRYYTIQGNILLGQQILDSMEARFLREPGDLAHRLMAALQGANVVGADTRCDTSGNSSLSSFLRVAKPDDHPDTPYINIIINSGPRGYEPLDSLQERFDELFDTVNTGMNEINDNRINVIRGSAKGSVRITGNLSPESMLELYDSTGKKAFSGKIISQEMKVGPLPKGIYVWKIMNGKKYFSSGKIAME